MSYSFLKAKEKKNYNNDFHKIFIHIIFPDFILLKINQSLTKMKACTFQVDLNSEQQKFRHQGPKIMIIIIVRYDTVVEKI